MAGGDPEFPQHAPFLYMLSVKDLKREQNQWQQLDQQSKLDLVIHAYRTLKYEQKNYQGGTFQ